MQSPLGHDGAIGDRADRRERAGCSRSEQLESTFFGANLFVFALAMLLLGLISFVLRLEKVGYSYACITLAIIVMFRVKRRHGLLRRIASPKSRWEFWWHRSVGVWREEQRLFENRPPINKQLALVREVTFTKIHEFVARSDLSAGKQFCISEVLRQTASPLLIPL